MYAAQQAVIAASGNYKAVEAQLKAQQEQLVALQEECHPLSTKDELFVPQIQEKSNTLCKPCKKSIMELAVAPDPYNSRCREHSKIFSGAEAFAFKQSREEYKNRLAGQRFCRSALFPGGTPFSSLNRVNLKQEVSSYEQRLVAAKDRLTRAQSVIEGKELPNLSEFAAVENKAAAVQELSNRLAVLAKDIRQITELLQAGKAGRTQ